MLAQIIAYYLFLWGSPLGPDAILPQLEHVKFASIDIFSEHLTPFQNYIFKHRFTLHPSQYLGGCIPQKNMPLECIGGMKNLIRKKDKQKMKTIT